MDFYFFVFSYNIVFNLNTLLGAVSALEILDSFYSQSKYIGEIFFYILEENYKFY